MDGGPKDLALLVDLDHPPAEGVRDQGVAVGQAVPQPAGTPGAPGPGPACGRPSAVPVGSGRPRHPGPGNGGSRTRGCSRTLRRPTRTCRESCWWTRRILVGDAVSDIRSLTVLRNVHHLGFKTLEPVPAYGAGFDVSLMPYRDTAWIRSSNPIKLKEYLALGLEVVSMDFPEARRAGDLIHVAGSEAEFVDLIKMVLGRAPADPESQPASTFAWWRRRQCSIIAIALD